MDDDRRRHTRYQNDQLTLSVARPGIRGILRINPTAECLNFSRDGLQFACDQTFKIGERVVLDLQIYNLELDEIKGEVMTQRTLENGLCCHGIRFCKDDKRLHKPDVRNKLLVIEDRLRTATVFPD